MRIGFAALVFAFFALSLEAEPLLLSFRGSVLVIPEDNGLESDPMPVLPSVGTALAVTLGGPFWVELSLDIYSTHYRFSDNLQRPVPAAVENRWTTVIGFMLSPQMLFRYSFSETAALRIYGGPAADLRLCLMAEDLNDDEQDEASRQTAAVADYFWGEARWFLPVLGAGMDFKISEKLALGFDFRVWFPLYKLWAAEDLPPIEGWRFGGGLRLTIL